MSYSLVDFCDDVRTTLADGDDGDGRETVRQKLELLLRDPAFCAAYVGPEQDSGMTEIYQDPNLGFCVLAYNMTESRTSPPHDHGRSWAVYGQALGYTDMTIWSAPGEGEGNIEAVRSFRLEPGQAGLFDVREIHSIEYPPGSKFVRVTGVDMSQETRRVFDPETGTVQEIEHAGTGKVR
ncbi:MAG: hypothetical protein O7H39_14885 [Gammaproteobacteria bacterium]|nr:hypothetical protein [Gammaproteobacteria bacterium]